MTSAVPAQPGGHQPGGHQPGGHRQAGLRRILAVLCVTEITSWGILYYAFPVLSEDITGDTGWSASVVSGAFSAGLVVSAVAGVLGRLGYATFARHLGVRWRTLIVLTAVAVTTGVLGVVTSLAALVAAGILAGMVRGIFTLLQATAITERWGATHYGHLSAVLSAPVTLAAALAPWIGAGLAGMLGGYPPMLLLMGALGLLAVLAAAASMPSHTVPD